MPSTMHVIDLKAIRKHAGLSQEQLAQLLKTSWVTISRWERGVAQPSHASAQRLERLTEVLQRIGQALPKEEVSIFYRRRIFCCAATGRSTCSTATTASAISLHSLMPPRAATWRNT